MPRSSSTHPPRALLAATIGCALLPALGVLAATRDPVAAAVALALGPVAAGGGWAAAHRTLKARLERLAAAADALASGTPPAAGELRRLGLGRAGRALDDAAASQRTLALRARLLDEAPHAVIAADPAGTVTYANAAALALLDAPAGAVHGRGLRDLLPDATEGRAGAAAASPAIGWTATPLVEAGRPAGVGVWLHRR